MASISYLSLLAGESADRIPYLHRSSQRRLQAFGIALHIPLVLWATTGYMLATNIFGLPVHGGLMVAGLCMSLIYMVERLVLAAPRTWYVNVGRLVIGCVMAMIGATAIDLIVFDREVTQQLRADAVEQAGRHFDEAITSQEKRVETARQQWMIALGAANCEADGTCGSGLRNLGPIHRELVAQAELLRSDYLLARERLQQLERDRAVRIEATLQSAPQLAGLLQRVEALRDYASRNPGAFAIWILFFTLIMSLELMVVFVKVAFGETVDDHIDRVKEEVDRHRATQFREVVMRPDGPALALLESMYSR